MEKIVESSLRDGTLVRHKNNGYEGKIEGTTAIKACFTKNGALLALPNSKEPYQYRVVVTGEPMRYVAPVEDLEILDAVVLVTCVRCQKNFHSKPGLVAKANGRCACTAWICPVCLGCQSEEAANDKATSCAAQRKRFLKKAAAEKK